MGVLSRMRRLLRANLNDVLERAEDPAKMVNYLVLEMEEQLEQAREEVATAMAIERRLGQQAQEAREAAEQWHRRARRAVEHGEDALAAEAIRRRMAALDVAEHYRREYETQAREVARLRGALEVLQQRLREAQARRTTILAQVKTSNAQQVVARSLRQAVVGNDAFAAFDRLAAQAQSAQFRAAALVELSGADVTDAFLVSETSGAVERELAALKREVGYLEGESARPALEQHGEG